LIPTGERSLLQTHIAATEKRFVVRADEELTAFLELESALLAAILRSYPASSSTFACADGIEKK
jgi:hypothetical protein